MKIGIIGAGNIGGNLTRRLTALGHDVSVANSRGPETLTALAQETGATAVTAAEAARGAEIVVVTVPLKNVPDLPDGLLDGAAEGFTVIDTGNYYPRERDGRIDAIEDDGLTESRWTERRIGHPVIKAFNGTYAQDILDRPRPAGDPERLALPVAGDDAAAKEKVRLLIDELGFDTVDAGGIDDSWRQQPDTPVYGLREGVDAVTKALSEASPSAPRASGADRRPAGPRYRIHALRRRLTRTIFWLGLHQGVRMPPEQQRGEATVERLRPRRCGCTRTPAARDSP